MVQAIIESKEVNSWQLAVGSWQLAVGSWQLESWKTENSAFKVRAKNTVLRTTRSHEY